MMRSFSPSPSSFALLNSAETRIEDYLDDLINDWWEYTWCVAQRVKEDEQFYHPLGSKYHPKASLTPTGRDFGECDSKNRWLDYVRSHGRYTATPGATQFSADSVPYGTRIEARIQAVKNEEARLAALDQAKQEAEITRLFTGGGSAPVAGGLPGSGLPSAVPPPPLPPEQSGISPAVLAVGGLVVMGGLVGLAVMVKKSRKKAD